MLRVRLVFFRFLLRPFLVKNREKASESKTFLYTRRIYASLYTLSFELFSKMEYLKDGNLCRLKIAIIRVTFMYFFFNSKIRISIEISIVSIRDHPHFYIV